GATFQRVRGVEVDLPSVHAEATPDDEALVITVPEHGPLRFGDREVQPADVPAALASARSNHTSVLLLADRQADVQRAVEILAEAQRAGFPSVSIATRQPGGEPP